MVGGEGREVCNLLIVFSKSSHCTLASHTHTQASSLRPTVHDLSAAESWGEPRFDQLG